MKNTLFTRRALESECRCSRRHLEEYNQHGVWCWWRQSWCRHVRESRFVSMFFLSLWKLVGKCAKFLCPCNIMKSRLVSRLRFFFLHLMMTPNDDNFFICVNVYDDDKTEASFRVFYLRLQSLLTFALEFVSPMKIIFFYFLSEIRSSSCQSRSKRKSIMLLAMAVFRHLKCCDGWVFFLFLYSRWGLKRWVSCLLKWKRDRGSILERQLSGEGKEKILLFSRKRKRKNIAEAQRKKFLRYGDWIRRDERLLLNAWNLLIRWWLLELHY